MILWFSHHYVAYTPPFCDKYTLCIFFTITTQTRKIRNFEVLSQWFHLPHPMFYFFLYSLSITEVETVHILRGVHIQQHSWQFHSFGMTASYPRGTEFIKKLFVVCKICTQQVFLLRRTVSSWMLLCVLCMKWIKWMDKGRLGPFTHPNASSPILLNRYWRNLVLWSLHLNQKGPDV
jgi:hypothetical protein